MTTHVPGQDVVVLNASPSDASDKRIHHNANFSFTTINTTPVSLIASIASDRTFYLTDLLITIIDGNTTTGICSIRDSTTVKIPFLAIQTIASTETGHQRLFHTFKEPIPFTTSVVAVSGNATGVVASICIAGYYELDGLK